jgi:hypothetical protein
VNLDRVARPKPLRGLGIQNLEYFGRDLRLRWLWYEWVDGERTWAGTEAPFDEVDKHLFRASTTMSIRVIVA